MRIWAYGDDINTDMLFPGKYTYTCAKPDEIKPHLLEDLDPEFPLGDVGRRDLDEIRPLADPEEVKALVEPPVFPDEVRLGQLLDRLQVEDLLDPFLLGLKVLVGLDRGRNRMSQRR